MVTAFEAPLLDTNALFAKPDNVAKTIDLDVSTMFAEQIKDPVLGTIRSGIRKGISPEPKSPRIQQSKGLLRYYQEIDRLLIEEEGQLYSYSEPTDEIDFENLRNCSPLSLFLACFRFGHYNGMGGHMSESETYQNAKRFYYWLTCNLFHYYTIRTEFFVDKMISPEYFKDQYMDTFRSVAYVLEHCGIYFSVLFL